MGISTGVMRAALFAIGAGLAGLAGAVLAPLSTLNPQFGLLFLVNSFLVVILGGQGSLRGLIIAGIVLGGSLAILQFNISTVYAQIVVLVIAIVGVRLRPVFAEKLEEWRDRRARGSADTPAGELEAA
jgi:branched-subunit amino acid ABC-type transport system permease component